MIPTDEWWAALDLTVTEAPSLEMPMAETNTLSLKTKTVSIPVGTQYELPLDRKWALHGFKTTSDWYEWTVE